jgi:kinesin family member 2/24
MDPKMLISSFRNKVDLTKYIEEHNFNFDNVFDENADNNVVSLSQL